MLFLNGQFVPHDIKKGMLYLSLSAMYNNSNAQYILGIFYYYGIYIEKNVNRSLHFLIQSSQNGDKRAYFCIGYIYHECEKVYDINEAIHYYKAASNVYDQFAKNNLGVLYWINQFDVKQNIALSIEYFNVAITQKNDLLSMFNLACIYLYNDSFKDNVELSIDLLIKSSNRGFHPSKELLCLALIKKFGFNLVIIKDEIDKLDMLQYQAKKQIFQMIVNEKMNDRIVFERR